MAQPTAEAIAALLRAVTFLLSIFSALLAAQLYLLWRSASAGRVWRPFILGALVFAAWSLIQFAATFFSSLFADGRSMALLMDGLHCLFILLFSYGFWLLRQAFYRPGRLRDMLNADELDGMGRPEHPEPDLPVPGES